MVVGQTERKMGSFYLLEHPKWRGIIFGKTPL